MRRAFPAVFLLSLATPAGAGAAGPFESAPGGYRVRFPGKPTVSTEAVPDKGSSGTAMYVNEKTGELFAVAYFEPKPDSAEAKRKLSGDSFEKVIEDCVDAWRMKPEAIRKFEYGDRKLPAWAVTAKGASGATASRTLFVMDKARGKLYLVSVHGGAGVPTDKAAGAFLDSFELLAKK